MVDAGIDTLYVNLLADELPLGLLHVCEDMKAQAQARDDTVVTPWCLWDAPLSMWKAGKGSSGTQLDMSLSFTKEVLTFLNAMHERDENPAATFKPKDFPLDVREKARMMGKAVPVLLPFKASD